MNTLQIIAHLRSQKAVINIYDGKLRIIVQEYVMTPRTIADIRSHKLEIIDYLKFVKQEIPKKYAYRFELKNDGGGTWVTDKVPSEARRRLADFYIDREIMIFELIN